MALTRAFQILDSNSEVYELDKNPSIHGRILRINPKVAIFFWRYLVDGHALKHRDFQSNWQDFLIVLKTDVSDPVMETELYWRSPVTKPLFFKCQRGFIIFRGGENQLKSKFTFMANSDQNRCISLSMSMKARGEVQIGLNKN